MTKTEPSITLDLDSAERDDAPTPFWAKLAGSDYHLRDPQDLTFDELLDLTLRPGDILPAVVEPESAEAFRGALGDLPAWKVNALAKAYLDHHDLPSDVLYQIEAQTGG